MDCPKAIDLAQKYSSETYTSENDTWHIQRLMYPFLTENKTKHSGL